MQVGDIRQWDFQADVFEGEYRLVEDLGGGRWIIEALAPSDALIDRVLAIAAGQEASGASWMSSMAEVEREIAERQARAGEQMTVQFISSAQYAEAF